MARTERRQISWGSADVEDATLTVELTGSSSKAWKQRFENVLALLETRHSGWGAVELSRSHIQVTEVRQGTETELRHFLESIVMQVNSELPEPEEPPARTDDDNQRAEQAQRDREMGAVFRAFAEDGARGRQAEQGPAR